MLYFHTLLDFIVFHFGWLRPVHVMSQWDELLAEIYLITITITIASVNILVV